MIKAAGVTPDVAALDALLPQTQCGQCGYQGCLPYAEAMAAGAAAINRCPPGGDEVIADLARLLNCAPKPLDTSCGVAQPPAVAVIDEAWCIGCTLCLQVCPVDAIAGALKAMHTVIAGECTGCALCLPPCPVDCIRMVAVEPAGTREARASRKARAAQYRSRHLARESRLDNENKGKIAKKLTAEAEALAVAPLTAQNNQKQSAVARALERAKARITKNKKSL